jgi:hypothetical protein
MQKHTISSRLKASDLPIILSASSQIKPEVAEKMRIYVFALMLNGYSKSLVNIAMYFGVSIASLSRLLSHTKLGEELDLALNRSTRKIIAAYMRSHNHVTVAIIIDATMIERSSQKTENVGLYHSNGKKIWGHRITNVGIILDGSLYIPLAVLSHKTKDYALKLGLSYLTEGMMVCHWIRSHADGLLSLFKLMSVESSDVKFLLDAGYDNIEIQKNIRTIGCHFLMMVKNTRSIEGFQIKEFFKRNRILPWVKVYFTKMVNGKKKRKKYRIRTAENVILTGVGPVIAVCSEKNSGRCKTKTRRFIVSSDLSLSGREILELYAKRWAIESWHKDMKQNYGINDCSCSSFAAIENHIKLCLIAFSLHHEGFASLPKKGASIGDFLQLSVRKSSRRTLSLITGDEYFDEIIELHQNILYARTESSP